MYWSSASLASQSSHVTHSLLSLSPVCSDSQSLPLQQYRCACDKGFESLFSTWCMIFIFIFLERHKETSKPSNAGGVKSNLKYCGRKRARGIKRVGVDSSWAAGKIKGILYQSQNGSLFRFSFTMRISHIRCLSQTCFPHLWFEFVFPALRIILYISKAWTLDFSFT